MKEKKERRFSRQQIERILGVVAVVTIIAAWVIGNSRASANVQPVLNAVLPTAVTFDNIENGTYLAVAEDGTELGYVGIGEAMGYGGPIQIAVAVSPQGEVIDFKIVDHKETPSYLEKILDTDFSDNLIGMSYEDDFILDQDVDGVSGATYSSRGIVQAVADQTWEIASTYYDYTVPEPVKPKIEFGLLEISLVLLYAAGYVGHRREFKYTKQLRWGTMIIGLVVLGFMFNHPLTLSNFNQLLLGYFPVWQTTIYWYLLLGGVLFVFTVDNKNPYCEWFCPFGAAQECLGAIGGAKVRSAGKFNNFLKWLRRGLVWSAILIAMILRDPGLTSYEIFGTLFDLTGTTWQFALLGVVLISSLFIKRPWCTHLCPLEPVTSLYRTFRKWGLEVWRKRKAH